MNVRASRSTKRRLVGLLAAASLAFAPAASGSDGVALVDPAPGAHVSGVVLVGASTPAAAASVEFLWSSDGVHWIVIATDTDASDGWSVSWDTRPFNGVAELKAVADGAASPIVSVTVDNTPPGLALSVAPSSFSPNGDRRKDTTRVTVLVTEPVALAVRVLDTSGNVVHVLADGVLVSSELRLRWSGRAEDGARARDGAYRIVARAEDAAGNPRSAQVPVRVDTRPPHLRWRSTARVVGARSLRVSFRLRDASGPLSGHFRFESAYGRVVRRWREELPIGYSSTTVSRRAILATLPGVYRIRVALRDRAGNRSRLYGSPGYRLDHAVRTRVVARVDNVGRRVALTFDDCVFAGSWDSILRTLARYRVTAAFFCPGRQVRTYPHLAARTVRAGHTLGSHGWDHARLYAMSYWSVLWRLKADRSVWWPWRGAATPYFRPPEGGLSSTVLSAAGAAGYRYTVLWDVDPFDWSDPGVGAVVARVVQRARAGSIILLHVKPQTAAALPAIIRGLRRRNLRPIGLDQLIHRRGARLSRGGW
jgi:peptidoglycan/xylan/chitin deacetylase (PgdA/CDA1 family)